MIDLDALERANTPGDARFTGGGCDSFTMLAFIRAVRAAIEQAEHAELRGNTGTVLISFFDALAPFRKDTA